MALHPSALVVQEEKDRLRKKGAALTGNAQTYGIGDPNAPPTDLQVSTLPDSGGNAPTGAPLPQNGANESQSGGVDLTQDRGTPQEMLDNLDPIKGASIVEESIQAIGPSASTPNRDRSTGALVGGVGGGEQRKPLTKEEKQQATAAIEAKTREPAEVTIKRFQDQYLENSDKLLNEGKISKKQHKGLKERWKNIFHIIPKEDMGLFLFDFGLRLMAASQEGGSLAGLVGQAGLGALGGMQARQVAEEENRRGDIAAASDYALETYKADTGRMRAESEAEYRKTVAGGYRGEKAWLFELGKKMGKSDAEIWGMFNKEDSEAIRRQKLFEFIREAQADASFTDTDPMLDKKYKDFTADDFAMWVEQVMDQEAATGALSSALDKYGDNK